VVMAEDLMASAFFQRKQQMQLASKMRYLAAQFLGLLENQLWLRNATRANLMARRLADGLRGVTGVELWQKVESNAVFALLHPAHIERLQRDGDFYVWDEARHVVRFMTAFDTTEDQVDEFVAAVRETAASDT
jgi:threonine aldolase